jgi:hypothetical protein
MPEPAFVRMALDPSLIKGVYNGCDQWCMYCPVTARCLVYRCDQQMVEGKTNVYKSLAERLHEGMEFLKRACDAEGHSIPQLDAMLSNDPRQQPMLVAIDDPIERLARRYGQLADAYLLSHPDFPFEMKPRDSGPTAFEVFAWFHQLVPAKVYRALVSSADAARRQEGDHRDALISAKVALIGMDRSLEALATIAAEDEDARLDLLQTQLRRLRREMEARFPDARSVVRPGLDAPADPISAPPEPQIRASSDGSSVASSRIPDETAT